MAIRFWILVSLALAGLWQPLEAEAQTVSDSYFFSTVAGPPEAGAGWYDGIGRAARFNYPQCVAVDGSNNVFVADTFNHTIRKINPSGVVTTLAGLAGNSGSLEGTGSAARFNEPGGLAVDRAGNLFVADSSNHVIRVIAPSCVVTTRAGLAGNSGSLDGTGSAARFNSPQCVAVDGSNNVFVADTYNHTIRKISPAGKVTTFAGLAGAAGTNNGTGKAARFFEPFGVAVDSDGNVFVADTSNHTIRKITSDGVVMTLAGNASILDQSGRPVGGFADGTGSAARFYYPFGVAVSGGDILYVADYRNLTIRKITPSAAVTTLAGLAGTAGSADGTGSAARFQSPTGLASDDGGNVFVADYNNHAIRRITAEGMVTTLAGQAGNSSGSADGAGSDARFYGPFGVAVDASRNMYVADTYNHTIRKITSDGVATTLAGSPGTSGTNDGTGSAARFNWPTGVAVDGGGTVYVADYSNHTIRRITPDGEGTTLAGLAGTSGTNDGAGSAAQFNQPIGLALDCSNNVFVADTYNHTIRRITPSGEVTTIAGLPGTSGTNDGLVSAARFNQPFGVAVGNDGSVYVADTYNHTIRKITSDGVVMTLAGAPGTGGADDGTGSAARFYYPFGVAVSGGDILYVADYSNHTIRRITPDGTVTTLGGLAGSFGNTDGSGSVARFKNPSGIAVDSGGNLLVADTANHVIRKGSPPLPDRPVVDQSVGAVGAARRLDVTPLTTTSWSWSFLRYPATSSAQFSSTTARDPSFTPDVPDSYVLRFEGRNDSGNVTRGTLTVVADATPPALSIVSPTPGQRWSNTVFTVTGTASDDQGVSNIWCQANGDAWTSAMGTTNWNASLELTPGSNRVSAYAMDLAGNKSPTNSVSFTNVVRVALVVQINGVGTVSPNYNGQSLEIGKGYSMTASAGSGYVFTNWSGGTNLPLTLLTNGATVQFTMQSNLTLQANFADVTKPTLTITAPTSNQRWSNALFTVRGTGSDNAQVANVWCQINGGTWTNATTLNNWTNWTADVTLVPGTNTVRAYAMDATGNRSLTNSVSLRYVVSGTLLVRTTGQGTLSPNYSNAVLEIGRSYSMTARAVNGHVFTNWVISTNWVGGMTTNNATVQFTMQSNLTLQANFADVTKPTLAITAPTAGKKVNAVVTARGTASDNALVTAVLYQLNSNNWAVATGTTNWSATMSLLMGTNALRAYALDASGNKSPTNTVSFVSSNTFQMQLRVISTPPLTGGGLDLSLELTPGLSCRIEGSTDLISWTSLSSVVGTNSTISFRDSLATNYSRRFYRAVTP
jgi:hypothetical protein